MVKSAGEELIWERLNRSTRASSQRKYTRIVKVSMRVADREGLDAITMRRIAAELQMGTMSLYRYVTTKDKILDLVMDAAFGEITLPEKPLADWLSGLRSLARATRSTLKRHPWVASLAASRPTFGPNYLRWVEFALSATASTGLDAGVRMRAIGTLFAFVSGAVAYEVSEDNANRAHKLTPESKRELAKPYLARIIGSGEYPELEKLFRAEIEDAGDASFEFGLNCVLAGIEQVLAGSIGGKAEST